MTMRLASTKLRLDEASDPVGLEICSNLHPQAAFADNPCLVCCCEGRQKNDKTNDGRDHCAGDGQA